MRTFELRHSLKKYTLLAVLLSCVPQLRAQWTAVVGAQSPDQARQALAFLPNEMWIHAGDNITLTVVTNEPHTVTFLTANQIRNPFSVGCPGYSSSPATVDGSTCVSSPPLAGGQTFTVVFPVTGQF
jgi:plastocyanin